MPHKRAKRSVREKQRSEKGHDLPPTKTKQHNEDTPKSASRVLNALKIREEFHKKRKREQEEGGDEGDEDLKSKKRKEKDEKEKISRILPGESLQHYNKRVEDNMRPLVRSAVKTSLATIRGTAKKEQKEKEKHKHSSKDKDEERKKEKEEEDIPIPTDKHANKPKEFQTLLTSAPKRLNDIVQAPPEMPRLKGVEKMQARSTGGSVGSGVLSMAQKMMMEQEREKVIKRYREMKAIKRKEFE